MASLFQGQTLESGRETIPKEEAGLEQEEVTAVALVAAVVLVAGIAGVPAEVDAALRIAPSTVAVTAYLLAVQT